MLDKAGVDLGLRNLSALLFFPRHRDIAYPGRLERAKPVRRNGNVTLFTLEGQRDALGRWEVRGTVQIGYRCVVGL